MNLQKIGHMKNLAFIAAVCAVCLDAVECVAAEKSSNSEKTIGYAVKQNYTALDISGCIEASFSETSDSVYVIADKSVVGYVKVERKGPGLFLSFKGPEKFRCGDYGKVTVVLPYNPEVDRIYLSGSSSFVSKTVIKSGTVYVETSGASDFRSSICADKVCLEASGASRISGKIAASFLDVELTGASGAELCGKADVCVLSISGASSLNGADGSLIETDTAVCDLSGTGRASLICNRSISGKVSGASSLRYIGDAEEDLRERGAASVRRNKSM